MQLLLSRHGNTFGPNDKNVWAGTSNDLPLVQKGLEQAENLAAALIANQVVPKAIYCSPLQRTRNYAQIVIDRLQLPYKPIVDQRLNEIDYGDWTGLTNEQVMSKFGLDDLENWTNLSAWPRKGSWKPSAKQMIEEVTSFAGELVNSYASDDLVLAVSSNGRLRYFLSLMPDEFQRRIEEATYSVKTGNIGKLIYDNGMFNVQYWNLEPQTGLATGASAAG